MGQKRVIILTVVYKKEISHLEAISLKQCMKVLGRYPIRLICPEGLDIGAYRSVAKDLEADFINPKWQKSLSTVNRLMIAPFLYKRYRDYEFILFYQLDAFAFRDDLEYWCNKDYDYIGAPWFDGFSAGNVDSPLIGVGNGGFSLRKTHSLLKARKALRDLAKNTPMGNNPFLFVNDYPAQEDIFWGIGIKRHLEWFKVAPIDEAIKFSFEVQPKLLYDMNNQELPFGCHAWWRYDLEFWRPFIESEGYSLPGTG
jgi:hypothetical protein